MAAFTTERPPAPRKWSCRAVLAPLLLAALVSGAAAQDTDGDGAAVVRRIVASLSPPAADSVALPDYAKRIVRVEGARSSGEPLFLDYNRSLDLTIFPVSAGDRVTADTLAVLDRLGRALASPELKGARFLIGGHTDGRGADAVNQALSERRALAVRRYLVEVAGVPADRLVVIGFGESAPIDAANPADAINRRVEVTLIASPPKGGAQPDVRRLPAPARILRGEEVPR